MVRNSPINFIQPNTNMNDGHDHHCHTTTAGFFDHGNSDDEDDAVRDDDDDNNNNASAYLFIAFIVCSFR